MIRYAFSAMGTDWTILVQHGRADASPEAERVVRDVESRLSRFLPTSAVSRLNRDREASDPVLAAVLRAALTFSRDTRGAFDPSLGAQLASLGYDRTFAEVARPDVAFESGEPSFERGVNVFVEGADVRLAGYGCVDLGGIAKGWAVDRAIETLAEGGAEAVLVDGGGDIAVRGGEWPIGVSDDLVVTLRGGAIATSSTRARRWCSSSGRWFHHVVNPRTGLSAESPVDTVTVVAPDATTADVLATAALVDPSGQMPRLSSRGYQAAMRDRSGAWYTTPNWSAA